ncbi:unnamed protein product [Macrosiphum euphorbiae]|uniref:ISXO2-like transposase domain-containing protein n=2 Tax=Macrosiphum euphorbiae TaxID=13131 RepID=A0AAV0WGP7_9HEMI|nr:unnamed protein product [Macrosiphum euphorbiae]
MWSVIKLFKLFDCNENDPLPIAAIEQLQSWGLIAKPNTLKCKNNHFLILTENRDYADGFVWRCRKRSMVSNRKVRCDVKQSLRKNTFFEKSHLPIWKIVIFSHLWTENVSILFIKKQIDIATQTVVDWASFHREVVYDGMILRHQKIGGEGKTVEIDESKFGRRKYHRGHRVEGQWVFGGVERETGKSFLIPVERRDKETLLVIIKDWILPGTLIMSDCWKSYDCLKDEGYTHLTVNHSIEFKNPDTGAHTNNVEGMWRHAKASMSQYCRKKRFYAGYLAKYMFLKSCRLQNVDPLAEFFKLCSIVYDPVDGVRADVVESAESESGTDSEIESEDESQTVFF